MQFPDAGILRVFLEHLCRQYNECFSSGSERMNADNARDLWDADYIRKGNLFGSTPRQLPPLPAGARVLELGCGNGKSLSAMVHRDWVVVAIDFSLRAALLARKIALQGAGADLAVADARVIPFRDQFFDAVVAYHILGHGKTSEREMIARDIFRCIRPGGQLWFCDFSTHDFRFGAGRETEPGTFLRGNGIQTHYFTEGEVTDLFPEFVPVFLRHDEWALRIRGKDHIRSEISAVFRKSTLLP